MSYETEIFDDHIIFRLFAPDAASVDLNLISETTSEFIPMEKRANNVFELKTALAKLGDSYFFRINNEILVPDPFSKYQPNDVHGPTKLIKSSKNTNIQWKGLPWEETCIS